VSGQKIRGYSIVQGLEHIHLGQGQGVERAIDRLQQLPFVEYVEPDYVLRANTNDTYYDLQWGLNNTGQDIRGVIGTYDADINAEEAWTVTTGNPEFVVAVIDTGTDYTHEDMDNNIWTNSNEIAANGVDDDSNGYIDDIHGFDFWSNDADPMDGSGHGTHVSGTICAESGNNIGVAGVAWECQIMALRFLGPNGGYTSDAISALNYAVDMGVAVSNNSWGGGGFSQSLYNAIQNAGNNGHLFVAAAGNDNINTDTSAHYPSSYDLDNIVSVAATDNQDHRSSFSNYGFNSVDVGAPGTNIANIYPNNGYVWMSGTSMAAPHVTGLATLIWALHPDWTPQQVRTRIFNTVRPLDTLYGITSTGGIINAYNALLEPTAAPIEPSNLVATAISNSQIDLTWADNSVTEDGFKIERSLDSSSWGEIASVGKDVSDYSDSSLDPETTYYYQVKAFSAVGDSAYSNSTFATTEATPTSQEVVASGEIFGAGTVSGTYEYTWSDDEVSQSITERKSGGRPSSRYSYLQHTWTFEVPSGTTSFHMNAWSSPSTTDGNDFIFSYSLDGTKYTEMLRVSGGNTSSWHSYIFPPNSSGMVYVRVIDADRTAGNLVLDTVTIDQMYILTEQEAGNPPASPTGLTAVASTPGQVDLAWQDNSGDEDGFEVERSSDGSNWSLLTTVNAGDTEDMAYTDTTVASETTYHYRTKAYNGAGYSAYSNTVEVTTPAVPLTLSATGYTKGLWQYVDLEWSEPSMLVDIYRDDIIQATVSGGTYTDGKIAKGGGSYTYQVCQSGTSSCSNEVTVVF
jgi:subtilisin family serine protease